MTSSDDGTTTRPAGRTGARGAAKKAATKAATGGAGRSRRPASTRLDGVGEWRSGPAAGTALVSGVTFQDKGLIYAEVDGLAIFEGDIVLGEVAALEAGGGQAAPAERSIGISGTRFRWPGARVGYTIAAGLPNQSRVTDAIAHWEAKTRVRFTLRTSANAAQLSDFITFQPSSGCSSSVGRQGGQQFVNLGPSCTTGNTIHEIGHALGLWHEQSRQDRDSFVKVIWAKIDASKQHNFSQHVTDGDDLGSYDFGSIMHYPLTAFSTDGSPTLQVIGTVPSGVTVGQRSALSAGDVAGIHTLYPQPSVTVAETVPNKALRDLQSATRKEVAKDPIVDALSGGVTRKELALDGWRLPSALSALTRQQRGAPFVLGAPSGFPEAGEGVQAGADEVLAAVGAQLADLGEAVQAIAEQQAALLEQQAAIVEQQAALAAVYEATFGAAPQP